MLTHLVGFILCSWSQMLSSWVHRPRCAQKTALHITFTSGSYVLPNLSLSSHTSHTAPLSLETLGEGGGLPSRTGPVLPKATECLRKGVLFLSFGWHLAEWMEKRLWDQFIFTFPPKNDLSPIGQEPLLIYEKNVVIDSHDTQHGNHLDHASLLCPGFPWLCSQDLC